MACSIDHKNRVINRYTNIFKSAGLNANDARQLAEDRFNAIANSTNPISKIFSEEQLNSISETYNNNKELQNLGSLDNYVSYLESNYNQLGIHYGQIFDKYDSTKTVTTSKDLGFFLNISGEESSKKWKKYRDNYQKSKKTEVTSLKKKIAGYEKILKEKGLPNHYRKSYELDLKDAIAKLNKVEPATVNEKNVFAFKSNKPYITEEFYPENKDPEDLIKEGYDSILEYPKKGYLEQGAILSNNYIRLSSEEDISAFNRYMNQYKSTEGAAFIPDNQVEVNNVLNASNITQVFNDLLQLHGVTNESYEHMQYLRELLTNNVDKIFNKIDSINLKRRAEGNTILGITGGNEIHIKTNKATIGNNVQMSVIQTFMHELEHIKYAEYFNDPDNKIIVDEVTRLANLVRKHLDKKYNGKGYEAFLQKDSNGNIEHINSEQEEIAAAKAQYDHIFNNQDKQVVSIHPVTGKPRYASNYLHEFAAFATTNEAFRKELAEVNFKSETVRKGTGVISYLDYLYRLVTNYLADKINKRRDIKGDAAIDDMLARLTTVRKDMFFISRAYQSVIGNVNKFANTVLVNKIVYPLANYFEESIVKDMKKNGFDGVSNTKLFTGLALSALKKKEDRQKGFRNALEGLTVGSGLLGKNAVAELIREITGYPRDFIQKLNHTKRLVDQTRRHIAEVHKKIYLELFDNDLPKEVSIAIKKTVIDLDLSSLQEDTSTDELLDLLSKPKMRSRFIKQIEDELKKVLPADVYGYMIQQSRSLGSYLATGVITTDNNANLNAHNIVRMFGYKPTNKYNSLESTIDKLVTLYGIDKTTTSTLNKAHKKLSENKEAFDELLSYHNSFKEHSLTQLFNGVKTQTIKGYSSELYNPSADMKLSESSNDVDLLNSGYTLVDTRPLPQDPLDPQAGMYMYINKSAGIATWVQQIVSMRNESIKGSSIMSRASRTDNYFDYQEAQQNVIKIDKTKAASKTFTDPDYVSSKGNLVPVYDEEGYIADYRYLASKTVKDNVLEADNRLEEVLSRSFASITDKINSRKVNNDTADWLKSIYDEDFHKNPSSYYKFSANSNNSDIKNAYIMLPKDMRTRLINLFGDEDSIYIRKDMFNIVFGYRKISMNKFRIAKIVEDILQELTQIAKNNIVIKSSVIVGNVISNVLLNMVNGVPIEYQLKHMGIALKGIKDYRLDSDAIIKLQAKLDANSKLTTEQRESIKSKILRHEDRIARNPITPLIDAGLFQTIAEDVDPNQDIWNYRTKFLDWSAPILDPLADKIPSFVKTVGKYTYITNDTKAYEILLKSTQYSDFISRFTLYQYRMREQGANQKDVLEEINDDFVNYEHLTNKYLQYANDIGVVWFSKYFLRIQKIIARKLVKYPLSVFNSITLQDFLFNGLSDITDSAAFVNKNPFSIVTAPLVNSLTAATTLNGYELVF